MLQISPRPGIHGHPISPWKLVNLARRSSIGYRMGLVFLIGDPFKSCQSQGLTSSPVNISRIFASFFPPTQLLRPPPDGTKLNLEASAK